MMRSYSFLFWGFATVWIAIVAYLLFLGLRLRGVAKRIERLERETGERQNASL